jgi:DNA-binding transcriptional ArsR family regulator
MPKQQPTPDPMPSKELVLAAIERAECHRIKHDDPALSRSGPDRSGMSLSIIKEHLGLASGGWTTTQLRPTWEELNDAGLIEQARRSGIVVWRLTSTGQKQLDAARQAGAVDALPESPQHRRWREAHALAGERIGELRESLRQVLDEAIELLDTNSASPSDSWFTIGERIKHACWRLGSATHCLHEWLEPDDAHPDIDQPPHGQRGRRETHQWDRS